MSYVKQTWITNDVITAEKLNHMENGIEAAAVDPFIVNLTPTEEDFSGVMDKTCAEITAAYEAGKDIWFNVDATALGYELWKVQATIVAKVANANYGQAMAFLINIQTSPETLIFIFTDFDSLGENSNYYTRIYPLTPMSYG